VSAISHLGESYSQNFRELKKWESALAAGRLPLWRGLTLSADDRIRAQVIGQLMCQGEIDMRAIEGRYGIIFAAYFAEALARLVPLATDGLVTIADGRIVATARGRLLLRSIAMCFDAYLSAPVTADAPRPSFSRVV